MERVEVILASLRLWLHPKSPVQNEQIAHKAQIICRSIFGHFSSEMPVFIDESPGASILAPKRWSITASPCHLFMRHTTAFKSAIVILAIGSTLNACCHWGAFGAVAGWCSALLVFGAAM
jgi:hypothetical protein